MRRSLQRRMTVWFTFSTFGVTLVFALVTYLHLRHELTVEKWERSHPDRPDFILHGSYSDDEVNDIASELLKLSLLYSTAVAGVAFLIGLILSRQSLKPIDDINHQIQKISANNLAARVNVPEADYPLKAITGNINALLERIETAYREISEFSSRVAHELKTPLTLLRLQLEDSAERIEPDMAESLQDELRRMEHYVEQCLLIARAEQGQLEMPVETIHLADLLEDIAEPFSLLARENHRALVISQLSNPTVQTSRWALRQILHNLLSNALKHGEGEIKVELGDAPDGPYLAIRNAIKEARPSGTAIGLRIVEALVRQLPHTQIECRENGSEHHVALSWHS